MKPSPADKERLEALSDQLAVVQASPWQPSVVVRTMISRTILIAKRWTVPPLTMGVWMELERIRSPFISRKFADDASDRAAEVLMTLEVLTGTKIKTSEFFKDCAAHNEELERVIASIAGLFAEADSTIIPMKMEGVKDNLYRHGFGWWAILYAFLRERMSRADALATTVQEAWMLFAVHLHGRGLKVQGETYEQQDWEVAGNG